MAIQDGNAQISAAGPMPISAILLTAATIPNTAKPRFTSLVRSPHHYGHSRSVTNDFHNAENRTLISAYTWLIRTNTAVHCGSK